MRLAATAAGLTLLVFAGPAGAQDNRSLTNSELRAPQVIAGDQLTSAEPGDGPLYERLLLLQNSVKALTESLANANAEAEVYKRQAEELSLKLQALGVEGLEGDESRIEQRLLAAVRDLRMARKENDELRTQVIELTEVMLALTQAAREIPAETRLLAETELRKANELLGSSPNAAPAEAVEPTLSDGMVVDVKDELSLIVANLGDRHGVKIGMPFQVWRDGTRVGEVKVVDVREQICGAVIQNLESNKNPIKVGDRLRVNARN